MVRVWGYNDYFVLLDKARQSHIIARSVQQSM
jgi:pyruvate-formate lyase